MANTIKDSIKTRKIAFLAADGVNDDSLSVVRDKLLKKGAVVEIIAPKLGTITGEHNKKIPVDKSFLTAASVFYDAVYVPGGTNSVATLAADPDAVHFLNEAYKHCKAIAAHSDGLQVLESTYFGKKLSPTHNVDKSQANGLFVGEDLGRLSSQFINAIAGHRFWDREKKRKVPA